MDIIKMLSQELEIAEKQVAATVNLIDEGNTIPFIARYRKEVTGSLDDSVLRRLDERLAYLRNLQQKKEDVLRIITEQENMTDELMQAIENAKTLQEVEDIYRPFRPKRRTRATVAKEKGLQPLADIIFAQNIFSGTVHDLAADYINPEKQVDSADEAIQGAMDIIAEMISDNADFRKDIREFTAKTGMLTSKQSKDEDSVYRLYYEFSEPVSKVANHRVLAIDRGEKEGFLSVKIETDTDKIKQRICSVAVKNPPSVTSETVENAISDSYDRLIAPSIERDVRSMLTENAQEKAIEVFSKNLQQLLLQPPIKGHNILGVDPGYRTGCKIAAVDFTGKVLDTGVIYCTLEHHDAQKARKTVVSMIEKHNISIIAIGNGTASKESEIFVSDTINALNRDIKYVMVSEAGASVYSASELAAKEFPEYDVALRSAVSIARRLEDPLAELVKIDPKAIGVGQYQHDMNQKTLSHALDGVVERCVNSVGVDINTASAQLLAHVAGVNAAVAKNIVAYREDNGIFTQRSQLKKVSKLGDKAYQQCAGFLRIPEAENIFDNTAVHPESYELAREILSACGYTENDVKSGGLSQLKSRAKTAPLAQLAEKHGVGMPTVNDIIDELMKPGRDPRENLQKPVLRSDIMSIDNLKPGMVLKGTVRNITDFGAFVDIGVHQDGLVHISQICDKFIKHPLDVLSVGDVKNVKIVDIDVKRGRISLSMRDIDEGVCNLNN